MRNLGPIAIAIFAGIIGLALLAVVMGSGQTSGLLKDVGDTLSNLVKKAVNA